LLRVRRRKENAVLVQRIPHNGHSAGTRQYVRITAGRVVSKINTTKWFFTPSSLPLPFYRLSKTNTLTIYDLRNKFIAYTNSFPNIAHIVSEWGSIFVLTIDGNVGLLWMWFASSSHRPFLGKVLPTPGKGHPDQVRDALQEEPLFSGHRPCPQPAV